MTLLVGNKTFCRRGTIANEPPDTRRVKRTKRMAEEPQWRNQYISAELPTLAFVPHIELTEFSKYQMSGVRE